MFQGEGWIRGEQVSAGVQASQGFARPDHSSDIILSTEPNGLDGVTAIVACNGRWILAQWQEGPYRHYRYEPQAVASAEPLILQAGGTGICNIQETSCDMASGDRPE